MEFQDVNEYYDVGKILAKKWQPLLEGLEGEYNILSTAILLENELRHGGELISETTLSGQVPAAAGATPNVATFQHYLLPLVRRVYPNLVTNELVGVQPMTSPASLVFYLKYNYTGLVEQKADPTTGVISDYATDNGWTAAGTEYGNFIGNTWHIDPYYSLQTIYRQPLGTAAGDIEGAAVTDTLHASPYIDNTMELYMVIGDAATITAATNVGLFKITGVVNGTPASITITEVAKLKGTVTVPGLVMSAGVSGATLTFQATSTGTAYLIKSTDADWATTVSTAQARYANTLTFDHNMENNRKMPEIELTVSSEPVHAKSRKLRTKWSVEASQDLRAMHNVDAEQELVALLSNEIAAEIDRETLNNLIVNAGIRVTYDYSDPYVAGGLVTHTGFVTDSQVAGTAVQVAPTIPIIGSGNFDDRNKALYYQILEVSNQIYRQSLRGSGNWIMTSPEVAAKLESLREFSTDADSDFTYNIGIQFSGVLNNKFKVFKDPLFPTDLILVGYKGDSFMDAGYFYCPYIPLQITPTVLDPETFNPRKGLLTRYGSVFVENGSRMYGVIRVNNLTAKGSSGISNYGLVSNKSVQTQGRDLIDGGSDLL